MKKTRKSYNSEYTGDHLNRIAFPLGGIGAGMICLEGTGALSHVSVRNKPDIFNEPCVFSAVSLKSVARVLEGPVPSWKVFGNPGTGNGAGRSSYGLPRFESASFNVRFPFATIVLEDPAIPLNIEITGWSPFIPGDADNSSLPVAALEYKFHNPSSSAIEAIYSFNSRNFMALKEGHSVQSTENGFILHQSGTNDTPWALGDFAALVLDEKAEVNCAWFRGGGFDPLTMAWKAVQSGQCTSVPPISEGEPSPGGTVAVPLKLNPGEDKTIELLLCWYVPETDIRSGTDPEAEDTACCSCATSKKHATHKPWYSIKFSNVESVISFWKEQYQYLRDESLKFSNCFYDTTLPPEVIEAVAANLTILKSPTVLRQTDGRLWCWEGCRDSSGCCAGSCTHVWNYAQAIPHLFPELERSLRQTEFNENQNEQGHQAFRAFLPIRPADHTFNAAADGQLGGVMKVYREWRVSGDTNWLRELWPKVKASLNYCIETWDPEHKGVLVEPHHNTYDIEFWGPDSMCSSFYLGALKAAVDIGEALNDEVPLYSSLLKKGKRYLERELFNGEYFFQHIQWQDIRAKGPDEASVKSLVAQYSPEAVEILKREGPKYQYGNGCLSDGILGVWLAAVCGLGEFLNRGKVKKTLKSIYKYNFRKDLSEHANPQRPGYALGREAGLLLCSWPKGGQLSLPFIYSNEVWTGIEYQVASHLMMEGVVRQGLDIVRAARDRYDGRVRNPFNEYECGHWYARAMSSYALLQGLTGARYDAMTKVLTLKPSVKGDFRSFFATATGYGTVGVKNGESFIDVKKGKIDIARIDLL